MLPCQVLHTSFVYSLGGEDPGPGEDGKLLGEELEHPGQVSAQQVLPTNLPHARKVVDFLQTAQGADRE